MIAGPQRAAESGLGSCRSVCPGQPAAAIQRAWRGHRRPSQIVPMGTFSDAAFFKREAKA